MTSSNDHDRQIGHGALVLIWLSRLLLLVGCLAIVWTLYSWIDAAIYQMVQRRYFEEIAASQGLSPTPLAPGVAPMPEAPIPTPPQLVIHPIIQEDLLKRAFVSGSVLGQMQIPSIGISVMVAEGVSPAVLRHAAGHLKGTALPGQAGNVAIAAHRDTFFRSLQEIRENDTITLTTLADTYEYQVKLIEIVEPENTEVLAASSEPTLTLITCYPFYYIGPAPKRFVVRARQIPRPPDHEQGIISATP